MRAHMSDAKPVSNKLQTSQSTLRHAAPELRQPPAAKAPVRVDGAPTSKRPSTRQARVAPSLEEVGQPWSSGRTSESPSLRKDAM
jgi:hypothetical protein